MAAKMTPSLFSTTWWFVAMTPSSVRAKAEAEETCHLVHLSHLYNLPMTNTEGLQEE